MKGLELSMTAMAMREKKKKKKEPTGHSKDPLKKRFIRG